MTPRGSSRRHVDERTQTTALRRYRKRGWPADDPHTTTMVSPGTSPDESLLAPGRPRPNSARPTYPVVELWPGATKSGFFENSLERPSPSRTDA